MRVVVTVRLSCTTATFLCLGHYDGIMVSNGMIGHGSSSGVSCSLDERLPCFGSSPSLFSPSRIRFIRACRLCSPPGHVKRQGARPWRTWWWWWRHVHIVR